MPRYRFHVTPAENLTSILKVGIFPRIGARSLSSDEPFPAIYLFPDAETLEDALMGWLEGCFNEDMPLALLAVDTQGMSEVFENCAGFELMLRDHVRAESLVVISRDVTSEVDLLKTVHAKLNATYETPSFVFSL